MSELLMQTIVEKLEGIELFLKATDGNKPQPVDLAPVVNELKALKKELPVLLDCQAPDAKKLEGLTRSIDRLQQQIQMMPNTSRVEHRHHFHKGIWIAIALLLVTFFLAWGWMNTFSQLERYEAADIKYRYLKTFGTKALNKLTVHVDSLYQNNKPGFRNSVEQEERHIIGIVDSLRFAGEKKNGPYKNRRH